MSAEHDDDVVGHDPLTGDPITRKAYREGIEQHQLSHSEHIAALRRFFLEELTIEQLHRVAVLFGSLGKMKNPAIMVSWWEGQIDFALYTRTRDAAYDEFAALPPEAPRQPEDPETEIESAVVEGTLDCHDYAPVPQTDGPCTFTTSVVGVEGGFVCGLPADAAPHQPKEQR